MSTHTIICNPCGQEIRVRKDGALYKHSVGEQPCDGVPAQILSDPLPSVGPWIGALDAGRCSDCEGRYAEGDRVRSVGEHGMQCEACGDDPDAGELASKLHAEYPDSEVTVLPGGGAMVLPKGLALPEADVIVVTPDMFVDPTPPSAAVAVFEDPTPPVVVEPELNVSGQPKARYEWRGNVNMGYQVTDPATGDFRRYKNGNARGWTRATTFNKAATDSKAIYDWGKRNVVIGAAKLPALLAGAVGMTHESDRDALMGLVAEFEDAAGANEASDLGTKLHVFTELMDAGLRTWQDAPEQYQAQLRLYSETLAAAGLEPVPGLIERTTCIQEFGGVVGTFDRVFYHRPSGQYIPGDLKTGKTMQYAMNETETQLWIYAHGVNQNGIYDWNTDTWHALDAPVSETNGVIIHMPVKGKLAGGVYLDHADLEAGREHAELCHRNRTQPKSKVRPWSPPPTRLGAPETLPETDWQTQFENVASVDAAGALWEAARRCGVPPMELQRLVQIAQTALRVRG